MTPHPSITRLRELSEKATAPPWRERYIRFSIADSNLADDNDNFIAESRNALPVLLDCLEMALERCKRHSDKYERTERILEEINARLDTLKGGSDAR